MDEKFGAIIIDCPWSYDQYHDAANGAAKANYTCQWLDALTAIPLDRWMRPDTAVALWTTGPMIAEGQLTDVVRAWGLSGKAMWPWLKSSPSTADLATIPGIWAMGNAEYFVMCTNGRNPGGFKERRGKLGVLVGQEKYFWPRVNNERKDFDLFDPDAGIFLVAPKSRRHSRKPYALHEYMETFKGPYLELFATEEREGWSTWGYDVGYELGPWGVRKRENFPGQGNGGST